MKRPPKTKPAPPVITDALIAKLLEANLGNIVRKIKAGKPLTKAERKTLEEHKQDSEQAGRGRPRGERYVSGLAEAAGRLQISLALVKMCKAAGSKAFRSSGLVCLPELEEYIAAHPELNPAMSDLLNEQKEKTLDKKAIRELREHELMLARRLVIPVAEVKLDFSRAFVEARKQFTDGARTLAQSVALHCAGTEEQIAWAIAQAQKMAREALFSLSKKEWLSPCPHCGKEIK
jgi:hypothetical protein